MGSEMCIRDSPQYQALVKERDTVLTQALRTFRERVQEEANLSEGEFEVAMRAVGLEMQEGFLPALPIEALRNLHRHAAVQAGKIYNALAQYANPDRFGPDDVVTFRFGGEADNPTFSPVGPVKKEVLEKTTRLYQALAKADLDALGNQVVETETLTPQQRKANLIAAYAQALDTGAQLHVKKVVALAEESLGGKLAEGFEPGQMYNALEVAINMWVRTQGETFRSLAPDQVLMRLDDMLTKIAPFSYRDQAKDTLQQFSTPPQYAYIANVPKHLSLIHI